MLVPLTLAVALSSPAAADAVTFNKDVAPILFKHCASCHRPGEIGPFPLLTYRDAVKRSDFLKEITAERRMPPWKAEPGIGTFHDERRLSDAEIKTIAAWVDGGTKEGDAKDLPPTPKFPDGWQLGKPDLVLTAAADFTVPAAGRDIYRCFVLPSGLTEDKTVAAVEFRPGNRRVVHHALFFLDDTGAGRKKAGDSADRAWTVSGGGLGGIIPTGSLGGWAPGAMPRLLPDGTGLYLRKHSDLILQIHYHPTGKEEKDRSTVGIYFTKKPAEKLVSGIPLVNRRLVIPAGAERHKVTAEFTVPVDVQVVGIAPHMHLLGKEMKVVAVKPDGKKEPLIWIKDWDFNWQGAYRFDRPVKLPKGTKLELEAVYDNSSKNPRNPSSPPKLVHWGEQTTDEMCLCGVQVVTDTVADRRTLMQEVLKSRAGLLGRLFGSGDPGDK
jgi:hypothetical protein